MNRKRMKLSKLISYFTLLVMLATLVSACQLTEDQYARKEVYKPTEFASQDWSQDTSQYSCHRMLQTENMAILWEKGFGSDLSNPPMLEGQSMAVDLENLAEKLEHFYRCFRDTLQFVKEGSLSEKYLMMCMIRYSSEGTAYGGTYDDTIGAVWVTPNRLQDPKLNVLAHELGHSFQAQIMADGEGKAWCGSPFFEMTSQWMLWYVNPNWVTDENYHWQAFKENTHKSFLHFSNMYRTPYVLESWSERHGVHFIADMFRQGECDEDPILTYKRMTEISWDDFNDEMFENYQQLINFDYKHSFNYTRQWANTFSPFGDRMLEQNGWYKVTPEFYPENYGFNPIKLAVPEKGQKVEIVFKGMLDPTEEKQDSELESLAGWRYGFVGIKEDGTSIKGEVFQNRLGIATFTIDEPLSHLWFVVMGAPTSYWNGFQAHWPYSIKVNGTSIL